MTRFITRLRLDLVNYREGQKSFLLKGKITDRRGGTELVVFQEQENVVVWCRWSTTKTSVCAANQGPTPPVTRMKPPGVRQSLHADASEGHLQGLAQGSCTSGFLH
jgi:hypothetical protein